VVSVSNDRLEGLDMVPAVNMTSLMKAGKSSGKLCRCSSPHRRHLSHID